MQSSSRAPVLSATRSLVSCWITVAHPLLLGDFDDLGQAPALRRRKWPRLDDADDVADLRFVARVVRVELGRAADDLLVHRIGDDDAAALLPPAARLRFGGRHLPLPSTLVLDGQDPCDVALHLPNARGVLQRAGGGLEVEIEELLARVAEPHIELLLADVAQFSSAHGEPPVPCQPRSSPSRLTILALIGSFIPARRSASRARGSGTPASSNMTRPGLTTATHDSGEPF